jgi:hypothetical protein
MFPLTKKAMAAALAGAAIVSSLGPSAAPAAPGSDAAGTPCVPPPPSLTAASAGEDYTRLRAACASRASTKPVADESTASDGFDAPSAAIGAAAGTGVVIVLLAAGGFARRGSPTRRQRPAVEVQK